MMTEETPALGLRQATLHLAVAHPGWADLFDSEAALIAGALPGLAYDLHHIGSTAVPGLAAKPILDIAMQSRHEDTVAAALTGLGYFDRGYRSGRLFIRLQGGDVRTHNLHLYAPGDPDLRDQIAFRDALRADAGLRRQYGALKQALVQELGDRGRGQYAGRKSEFVQSVLRKTQE